MTRKQRRHKQDALFGNKTKKRRRRIKRENRNRGWTASSIGAEAFGVR